MSTVQLYTPNTIPTARSYQTIRLTSLVLAINTRRSEWANVDPTLSTQITVGAMFDELAGILEDMGLTNVDELLGLRSH